MPDGWACACSPRRSAQRSSRPVRRSTPYGDPRFTRRRSRCRRSRRAPRRSRRQGARSAPAASSRDCRATAATPETGIAGGRSTEGAAGGGPVLLDFVSQAEAVAAARPNTVMCRADSCSRFGSLLQGSDAFSGQATGSSAKAVLTRGLPGRVRSRMRHRRPFPRERRRARARGSPSTRARDRGRCRTRRAGADTGDARR